MNDNELRDVALALGRLPSGLFIVTARRGSDETGLLASWVQQCGFEPPQLTVCVKKGRDVLDWLGDGAAFTVNVLAQGPKKYLAHFGKGFAPGEDAFAGLQVDRPEGEAPVLTEALAHLCCRAAGRAEGGDHVVVIGTVVSGKLHDAGEPHVHLRKNGLSY